MPTTSEHLVVGLVAAAGAVSAAIDLRTRRVPNALTLGITAFGMLLAAAHVTGTTIGGALAGFAIGLVLMLPGHVIGATGGGDVKLFAALGTMLGPRATVMAFLYTAIAGGALALVVAIMRRQLGSTVGRTAALVYTGGANVAEIERPSVNNRFAYAPAIAIGALVAAIRL